MSNNNNQASISTNTVRGSIATKDRVTKVIDNGTHKQVGLIIYSEDESAYVFLPSIICKLVPTVLEDISIQLRILNSILYLGKEWLDA